MADPSLSRRPAPPLPTAAPLDAPNGQTMVQILTEQAVLAVPGVHALGSPAARAAVRTMGRIRGSRTTYGAGVSVETGEHQTAVDVDLSVEYGTAIDALSRQVRDDVITAVQNGTGLEVVEVNLNITGLHHPDDDLVIAVEDQPDPEPVGPSPAGVETIQPEAAEPEQAVLELAEPGGRDARAGVTLISGEPDAPADHDQDQVIVADQVIVTGQIVVVDQDAPADPKNPADQETLTDPADQRS